MMQNGRIRCLRSRACRKIVACRWTPARSGASDGSPSAADLTGTSEDRVALLRCGEGDEEIRRMRNLHPHPPLVDATAASQLLHQRLCRKRGPPALYRSQQGSITVIRLQSLHARRVRNDAPTHSGLRSGSPWVSNSPGNSDEQTEGNAPCRQLAAGGGRKNPLAGCGGRISAEAEDGRANAAGESESAERQGGRWGGERCRLRKRAGTGVREWIWLGGALTSDMPQDPAATASNLLGAVGLHVSRVQAQPPRDPKLGDKWQVDSGRPLVTAPVL